MKMDVVLTFFRGKKGIISRLPSGKIALVNKNSRARPKPKEKWICKVDFEKENFAVVTPIEKIVKKAVYIRYIYTCGHSILKQNGFQEVPESTPEPIIIKEWNMKTVCDDCKKNCKHSNSRVEVDSWTFGFKVLRTCSDCGERIELYDFSKYVDDDHGFFATDFSEFREIVKSTIKEQEILEIAMRAIDEKEQYVREYKEMLKKEESIKARMSEITKEIREFIKKNYEDFKEDEYYSIRIDEDKEEVSYSKVAKKASPFKAGMN